MVFSSPIFLFVFFPIMFGIYYLLKNKYKNGWLLLCSLVFYGWSGIKYLILLLVIVGFNFIISVQLEKKKKIWLISGIIINVGILGIYKYLGFLLENISFLVSFLDTNIKVDNPNIIMPIGISFFTFQILAYDIDLYWGKVERQKRYDRLLLYVAMFPQLIAGPIVRYIDVEKEISKREIQCENVYYGLRRFIIGLSEKVLLADVLGECLNTIFQGEMVVGTAGTWLGMIFYSLQIYLDFTGYSDMAIGMGEMLGFRFAENFINPYQAVSIQDFWRRWHISLSGWFRDYIYIPMGGGRAGKLKTYRNLFIVFCITGLWHGASWNFIIWGLWHGLFSIAERLGGRKLLDRLPKIVQRIYTLLIVGIGWLMFRTENLNENICYIKNLFMIKKASMQAIIMMFDIKLVFCVSTSIFICIKGFNWERKNKNTIYDLAYFLLFVMVILQISASEFSPFLYFRF